MISLSTSAFYDQSARQIASLRAEADDLQRQIGSGERLSRSSDDPVAAARLRTLDRSQRLAQINQQNSDLAQTDLKLADDALGSVGNLISRAQVLATQAANGTVNGEQKAAVGLEIAGLKESLLVIANSRNGAGHALFGGQAAAKAYADAGAGATYLGTSSTDAVDLGDGQTVTPSVTGPEVFEFDVGGTPTDLFRVLGDLAAALQSGSGDIAASHAAMDGLETALGKVTTAQTVIGARMSWIEMMDQRREATGELMADEKSNVGGADLATTMTRLQEITTVLQASQASFVRLSNLTLFDMLR
jgi:flagellar hook-associated protein 3 FlgL